MYGNHTRSQERVILVKNEPQVCTCNISPRLCFYVGTFQIVAVKTEPKLEPTEAQYSLADLDGITDLLPIQTGQLQLSPLLWPSRKQIAVNWNFSDFKVDAVSLNDLDFWDKGSERPEDRYVVASRPGHLEARWEQQHRSVSLSPPPPSHSHFPKNPAVWRFITSIYLPHSQMEPDDISSVQNREVGERQCGQLQQLTFRFQLQR